MAYVAASFLEEPDYNIALPDFEGPLDLLLHLVKKHELDIFHIPITFITSHYLKTLDDMRTLNIDVAGEYLVMAATLAYIKSRELLPREALPPEEDEDDGIDPRQALIKRLLEYQKYKNAALHLGQRPVVGRNVWNRGAPSLDVVSGEIDRQGPLLEVPIWSLIEALEKVLSRAKGKSTHDVSEDRLSLADTINSLVERLAAEASFTFESCFAWVEHADGVRGLRGRLRAPARAVARSPYRGPTNEPSRPRNRTPTGGRSGRKRRNSRLRYGPGSRVQPSRDGVAVSRDARPSARPRTGCCGPRHNWRRSGRLERVAHKR